MSWLRRRRERHSLVKGEGFRQHHAVPHRPAARHLRERKLVEPVPRQSPGFGDLPLRITAYPSATNNAGPVTTASWSSYSIWQCGSAGPFADDSNVWNGYYSSLRRFAGKSVQATGEEAPSGSFDGLSQVGSQAVVWLRPTGALSNLQVQPQPPSLMPTSPALTG
jgi:hypothetical protein